MPQSNVEKVRNIILADPALQQRLKGAKSENEFVQLLVEIGAGKGLPFTPEDVNTWKAGEGASIKLADEQLEAATGGRTSPKTYGGTSYGNSIWCGFCGATSGTYMT